MEIFKFSKNGESVAKIHGRSSWIAWLAWAPALLVGLSGCATGISEYFHNGLKVGPNYTPPATPLPEKWVDEPNPRVHRGDPNLACWWEVFDDPMLNDLLHRAYAQNLTVRAAAWQIIQAQSQRDIALGELFPQSQAFGFQYTRSMASENGGAAGGFGGSAGAGVAPGASLSAVQSSPSTPVAGVTSPTGASTTTTRSSPNVGVSVGGGGGGGGINRFSTNISTALNASWEIDFWGLFRRNLEAADASLDQSLQNYDELVVILLANVATQYVEIRTLQKRLDLARKNVATQEPLVEQFAKRYKTGIANSYPGYFQLKSNLDNTKALIPPLETALRQANNQLCVLLGLPVHDMLPELGNGPDPAAIHIPRPKDEAVVVGIPGELLLRRPDVQAAEQQLRIQSAQIGIAEAEMYPHIGINGSIGLAANSFPKLFYGRSWTGNIGPSLSWNILNYGRLLANVRVQSAQYQQFVAQYQNTVLTANQDAENAMIAYLQSLDQDRLLRDSAEDAANVTTYLIRQFSSGFLPPGAADTSAFINQMFTATNFQVSQQDAASQAEGNVALNLILLYRAMGGGWQIRLRDGGPLKCAPETGANWFSTITSSASPPIWTPVKPAELPMPKPVPPAPAP